MPWRSARDTSAILVQTRLMWCHTHGTNGRVADRFRAPITMLCVSRPSCQINRSVMRVPATNNMVTSLTFHPPPSLSLGRSVCLPASLSLSLCLPVFLFLSLFSYPPSTPFCLCVCLRACVCVCACARLCMSVCVHSRASTRVYLSVSTCMIVYVYACGGEHPHVRVWMFAHVCVVWHTHKKYWPAMTDCRSSHTYGALRPQQPLTAN